jgi:hypothetical protein
MGSRCGRPWLTHEQLTRWEICTLAGELSPSRGARSVTSEPPQAEVLSSHFAGIPFSPSTLMRRDAAVADLWETSRDDESCLQWPASFRNAGRHQIGTVAGIKSESPSGLKRIRSYL